MALISAIYLHSTDGSNLFIQFTTVPLIDETLVIAIFIFCLLVVFMFAYARMAELGSSTYQMT